MNNAKKKIGIDFIPSIIVIFLIIYNNETYRSILSPVNTVIIIFCLSLIYLILKMIFNKAKVYKMSFVVTILLISLILISSLVNNDMTGGHVIIILSISIAFIIINLVSFDKFVPIFLNTVAFLAIFSLITTYILKPLFFGQLLSMFPSFINIADVSFIDMFFTVLLNDINYYRNFGIFREPGVYQIFLNFALLLELFYLRKKINLIRLLIFYIAILSTFSTPGYIVCLLLLLTYLFSKQDDFTSFKGRDVNIKYLLSLFILMLFSITLYLYFTNLEIQTMFNQTINKLLYQESSFVGRTSAIAGSIVSWAQNPIFGNGIIDGLNIKKILEMNNINSNTQHLTSTFGGLLSVYGILFSGVIFICLYRLINIINMQLDFIIKLILFFSICVMFNTQLLIYNEIFYLLCLFGALPTPRYNYKKNT